MRQTCLFQEKIALLGEGVWEVGETLYRYMMKQRFNGLSREIHFGTDRSIVDKRFGLFNVVDGKTIDDYFDYGGIGLSKIGENCIAMVIRSVQRSKHPVYGM